MIRRINLIPPSERPRTKTDFGMLGLIVIAVVVIAGIGLSYVYFNGVLTDRKRELEQVQAQSAQARNELAALAEYEALGNQRRDAEEVVQHIYAGRTLLSQTLGDLSLVIPKEVWLQQLSVTAPAVPPFSPAGGAGAPPSQETAAGTCSLAGTTYTFEDVATMLVRLEQIPSLKGIKLGTASSGAAAGGTATGSGSTAAKSVKTFSIQAIVVNTQSPETPLPISQVQVAP